jgi:hypothetical protein
LTPDRLPWEIAMIRVDDDGTRNEHSFMVNPVDLSKADPKSLQIGGFYQRHPYGQYLSGEKDHIQAHKIRDSYNAAVTVAEMTHGAKLVCINPVFDDLVLANLLRGQKMVPAWHYHPQDIAGIAVGYLAAKGELPANWKSDELAAACGVEAPSSDERHTALGDCRWTERWWIALGLPYPAEIKP